MKTLIIDAPEVVQRALANALDERAIECRFQPDRRTEAVVEPERDAATSPDALVAAPAADVAIWFAEATEGAAAKPDDVVEALIGKGVSRLIVVVPLRGSGHAASATADAARTRADRFAGGVAIVSSSPVFGPGDELVSRLLIMMRSLPVIPLLARGAHRYQPVWHEDLASLLVRLHDADEGLATYRVAGPDVVTQSSLYEAIAPLIGRSPARVPVPELLTTVGLAVIDAASGATSATDEAAWAIEADHAPLAAHENDLERLLGRPPMQLEAALRHLTVSLPEQLPGTGVGSLDVKHFWGDIRGTALTPPGVLSLLRDRFADVMPVPVGVEPAAPQSRLVEDATITIHLPGRGHVQVRVVAADDAHVVLSTLRGHALAGVVRFRTAGVPGGVRFEVMTGDRAATPLDWVALTLGAARIQDANWRAVVTRMADVAGGTIDKVHSHKRRASEAEVEHLSTWVARLIESRAE